MLLVGLTSHNPLRRQQSRPGVNPPGLLFKFFFVEQYAGMG